MPTALFQKVLETQHENRLFCGAVRENSGIVPPARMAEMDPTLVFVGVQSKSHLGSNPFIRAFLTFPANERARLKLCNFKLLTGIFRPELEYVSDF
jgi:hypothetical protein